MLLSIIIPIYNVEQYIGTCFESLFKQDLDSSLYEIIAVNDGTPDNSMKIVEEYGNHSIFRLDTHRNPAYLCGITNY